MTIPRRDMTHKSRVADLMCGMSGSDGPILLTSWLTEFTVTVSKTDFSAPKNNPVFALMLHG